MNAQHYAKQVMAQLGEDPAGRRYALCISKVEMLLVDEWCLLAPPTSWRAMEVNLHHLRRSGLVQQANNMSHASLLLVRALTRYETRRAALIKEARHLRSNLGERTAYEFDARFVRELPRFTDPVLHALVGASFAEADHIWFSTHAGTSQVESLRYGQQLMDQLLRDMAHRTEQIRRQVAHEEEQARRNRYRVPGMGGYRT